MPWEIKFCGLESLLTEFVCFLVSHEATKHQKPENSLPTQMARCLPQERFCPNAMLCAHCVLGLTCIDQKHRKSRAESRMRTRSLETRGRHVRLIRSLVQICYEVMKKVQNLRRYSSNSVCSLSYPLPGWAQSTSNFGSLKMLFVTLH